MNVSFMSGRYQFFSEAAGYASMGSYNGVLGLALDRLGSYAYLTSGDGKTIRKLSITSTEVGLNIAGKYFAFIK